MPQLHLYVPDQIAERIRQEAQAAGLSVSQFLADVVKRELQPQWPISFFEEVVGGWQGEPLERADQGDYETREALSFEQK